VQQVSRRRFLGAAGSSIAAALMSDSIAKALAIPAHRATRSVQDIEHIVVLMQENRSFDHYFGVMRGVRGYGDPHPAILPSGQPVWYQADGSTVVPPFRPEIGDLALTFFQDLDHGWNKTHEMFDSGKWDKWLATKTPSCMAHMQRSDLPFHYALADAFTICDAYYCSMLGPTDPNRYYMWTGWDGNDGKGGGPVIANDEIGYSWTTYPERLQAAGVSWKIYQDVGAGLDAAHYWGWGPDPYIGNYGDNSLLYFLQYQNAAPGTPLYDGARVGTDVKNGGTYFDMLAADVRNDTLPSVSWIVAPEAVTEHPAWPAGYGAWYTAGVLDALTSNPDVWSKTALLICFDENDGFFDHVVSPYPNVGGLPGQSTVPLTNEFFAGTGGTPGGSNGVPGPYGLGVRVPMVVVSPWSKGGWVCSETFDHTSLIRLMETRFGVEEPNLTPWRRAICGDLTSAFDFTRADDRTPSLPDTSAYKPTGQSKPTYTPTPPPVGSVPTQEPGVRPSRRLGYRFHVAFTAVSGELALAVDNHGTLGIHLQARSLTIPGAPYSYTVGAGDELRTTLPNPGTYDLSLHGPNGFFRRFGGSAQTAITAETRRDARDGHLRLRLRLAMSGSGKPIRIQLADAYGRDREVELHGTREITIDTRDSGGWYDVTLTAPSDPSFTAEFAGRLETAVQLTSDPQLGRASG
jgi:phospholipase C